MAHANNKMTRMKSMWRKEGAAFRASAVAAAREASQAGASSSSTIQPSDFFLECGVYAVVATALLPFDREITLADFLVALIYFGEGKVDRPGHHISAASMLLSGAIPTKVGAAAAW